MSLEVTILKSVGSALTIERMVYPLNVDGIPDMNNGVYLDDCPGSWWARLSIDDEKLIEKKWRIELNQKDF